MKTVRVGVIGVGNMGTSHARQISKGEIPGLELAAVCDLVPERMEAFADALHFTDAEELIASGEVDAVVIATPHYGHTTIGAAALEAGLHVLVEKPISVHKADCERLIAAHKGGDQVFAAMFNQRTDPHYIKLKELIDKGELGPIRRVVWEITNWFRTDSYYASGGWRATWKGEGGGVLLNQCPHQLDLYQWLFGMPQKIRAFCDLGRYHDIEVEDDVTAYMEYADGCKGIFITTTGEAPGTNRLEISAENGKIVVEHGGIEWTRNEVPMSEHCRKAEGGFSRPGTWEVKVPVHGSASHHAGILRNFSDAILKGAKLIAPAADGIRSVELGNAMLYSSLTDSTVDLPLDGAAYEKRLQELIAGSRYKEKAGKSEEGGVADLSGSF